MESAFDAEICEFFRVFAEKMRIVSLSFHLSFSSFAIYRCDHFMTSHCHAQNLDGFQKKPIEYKNHLCHQFSIGMPLEALLG
ncbi:hypothetical protein [Rhizobium leguminosarum]|uniref:hypothetical protein n=1 Tax=Rhizobium leguminosarum TaxID=384 RepID=UPI00144149A5|nr:hypothetical protein [Rhizobium leguminosarum]